MTPDYIIVGAGFFGATVAERLAARGHKILVIEKRPHIGGNSYSEIDPETGIEVHKYGSHIFHTSDEEVWAYLNRFTKFNDYRHTVWTKYNGRTYSLPINLGTINAFYGLDLKPFEARALLDRERAREHYEHPRNLEEQAVSLVGRPLYEAFIKGYTKKHWEKDPTELPAAIIRRLPVRLNYSNRYFSDTHEGIPVDGYGRLFERMLDHPNITVRLNTDWKEVRADLAGKTPLVYTGPIDEFFDHCHGRLEWRALAFEREVHPVGDYQGNSVVNYADENVPWTRIHEFRHFHPERTCREDATVLFKEFSGDAGKDRAPSYPVNTETNKRLLEKYRELAAGLKNVRFGGRLGEYRYFDMDDAVASALGTAEALDTGS
jgi:UDP-galactopyranose mutase